MPKWTILVVEDDAMLQQLYEMEFTEAGLGFYLAGNGNEACEILKRKQIDLIITDIRMPESGGNEVIDCVEENCLKIPIIVVSAFEHYRKIFADDKKVLAAFFVKPVDFKDLIKFVVLYLEGNIQDSGHDKPMQ